VWVNPNGDHFGWNSLIELNRRCGKSDLAIGGVLSLQLNRAGGSQDGECKDSRSLNVSAITAGVCMAVSAHAVCPLYGEGDLRFGERGELRCVGDVNVG
jgi:hypothetical protein